MKKRGQVTGFIIIGIVAFIIVLFLIFARDTLLTSIGGEKAVENYLKGQIKGVEDEIGKCVNLESKKTLDFIGKQGGFIESLDYVLYNEDKVTVLCNDIKDSNICLNQGLFNSDIEKRLNSYLKDKLKECISLGKFKEGFMTYKYELDYDMNMLEVDTRVNEDNVLFKVFLPVVVKKEKYEFSKDEFVKKVNVPLGRIIIVVNDILNSEASIGDFDIVEYSMKHVNEYDISMSWRGRNKIYSVNVVDDDYRFRFAVEGEEESVE